MRALRLLLAVLATLTFASAASAQNTFTVTAFGLTAFHVNGVNNRPLNLVRGQTYTFTVSAPGHAFYIKTAQVIGTASQYTDGVTGNGVDEGELTWTIPNDAPGNLFYQCGIHQPMGSTITITNPAAAPAIGKIGIGLLALLLVVVSFFVIRRRTRMA